MSTDPDTKSITLRDGNAKPDDPSYGFADAKSATDWLTCPDADCDPVTHHNAIAYTTVFGVHRSRGSGTLDELRGVDRPQGGG